MSEIYYREKIISLASKLFIETGDAKERILSCEDKIDGAYMASFGKDIPKEIQIQWEQVKNDLESKEATYTKDDKLLSTSMQNSISGKWNKSMEKHLLFFLSEFLRVL